MSTRRPPLHGEATTHSRIVGVGGYRPRRVVHNDEMARLIGRTEKWIESRCGIRERRFAAADETLASMSAHAGERALAHAGVPASEVDLVFLASTSNLLQTPPTAVRVAHDLGARGAAGIDLSAACAGFCHALAMASDAVRTGAARHVLVIGAERMTDIVDPDDTAMSFLFADGAGAAVVGPSTEPGIGPVVRGADGTYFEALRMTSGWAAYAAGDSARPWLRMDGRRVFRWAMQEVCPAASRALMSAGIEAAQLAAFVPHQSNLRMIELMAERIGLDEATVVSKDVVRTGNTSSASVPLALDALVLDDAVSSGDLALMVGFGAGLNYAGQVVRLP